MVGGGETCVGTKGGLGSWNTTLTRGMSVEEEKGKGLLIRCQLVGVGLGIECSMSV